MRYSIIIYILIVCLGLPSLVYSELPRTGQRTCFDQEGNIIEHTGTGQDCDHQAGRVWPEPRFKDNGDGTITDLLTGLMWIRNGSCLGWQSWKAAMDAAQDLNSLEKIEDHCANLTVSYDDWTVPTIQELESLLNLEEQSPFNYLNFYGFRNVQPDSYWSSTTGPNPYSAWMLYMDSGEVASSGRVGTHHVLLVRKVEKSGRAKGASGEIEPESESRIHLFEHLSLLREKIFDFSTKDAEKTEATSTEGDSVVTTGRFLDNGDGTVTDTITDLMWLKDVNCVASMEWQAALDMVKNLNADPLSLNCKELTATGYDDWALPNRNELRSLISYSVDLPALATDFPTESIQPYYWTSTSVASHPKLAYDIYMGTGALSMSNKTAKRHMWPVRPVHGRIDRPREPDKTQTQELKAEHYLLRPIGNRININWPDKRFTDYGNGTVIDNLTGLMWLKDASCLGKYNWEDAFLITRRLNLNPLRTECKDYSATYDNWQIPDIDMLDELLSGLKGEPAEWLNSQGAVNVQPRDYWSLIENTLNLYYSWAMNMGEGGERNYPKSFELFVWPFREQLIVGPVNPAVSIKINGTSDNVYLARSQELVLSVSMDYNKGAVNAEFRIWYDAPDGTVWRLTRNGQWHQDERMVFRGNMFNLEDYTVFHAGTSNLEPGEYVFHFSVTPKLKKGAPPVVFSSDLVLTLEEIASTEDVIDEEGTVLLE